MKAWIEMTPRERDAAVGEAFGNLKVVWRFAGWNDDVFISFADPQAVPLDEPDRLWQWQPCYRINQSDPAFRYGDRYDFNPIPLYTADHTHAHYIEDEIEQRGYQIQSAYVNELCELCGVEGYDGIWKLIRATPEQRCHAAWLVMTEPSHDC